jgi:hypothetical protein
MANNPEPQPSQVMPPTTDVWHAPFIFFENAPVFGYTNGVINITLSANRATVGDGGTVINEQVTVAYLRGNVSAAISLRAALDSALLLAAPTGQTQAS